MGVGMPARALAWLPLALMLITACSAAPAPSGSGGVGGSVAATDTASAPSPTVPATARPTSGATPAPTPFVIPTYGPAIPLPLLPGTPFDLSWGSIAPRGVPFSEGYVSETGSYFQPKFVRWGRGAVVSYNTGVEDGPLLGPMIWQSTDLVEWHRVVWPGQDGHEVDVSQLLVGGPGLVAFGRDETAFTPVLWVSGDGEHWEAITDLPAIEFIWARPGVIQGYGEAVWLSSDGRGWSPAGASPFSDPDWRGVARPVTLVDEGDTAIAFVLESGDRQPTAVYRLWADGLWRHLADLNGFVDLATRGSNGIVAVGVSHSEPAAWLSADGATWDSATGPSGAANLLMTPAGYVATSQRQYGAGCAGQTPAEQVAQTWTSHDGLRWRAMPEQLLLDHTVLSFLVPDGEGVVAIGLRWSGSFEGDDQPTFDPVAFEAALPLPEPSHTPLPIGGGCE